MTASQLPKQVVLRAIRYSVSMHEGMVVFTSQGECGPCWTRMAFQRKCGCWYVNAGSTSGDVMVSHIAAAMEVLAHWFGDDFRGMGGENDL